MNIFLNRIDGIRKSKQWNFICDIVFPVLIAFLCFVKVNKGLDITDSAYSCGNFVNLGRLDGMWFYSTFYANLIGYLFCSLPFGHTFIALNIYTGIIKLILALCAYYFFVNVVKTDKVLAFVSVAVAVSLCWCPTTILYNYLTYLFFFLGCMFLYKGLVEEKKSCLMIAGFILGSNVFVRLPNIVEASMIFALWSFSLIRKEKIGQCLKKTGLCVGGYLLSCILALMFIFLTRGVTAYVQGIKELFEMSGDVESYSALGMIMSVISQYRITWKYTERAGLIILLCLLIFLVLPKKLKWLKYVSSTMVSLVFVAWLYKCKVFNLNFQWFEPVYRYGAMILSIMIVWFVASLFLPGISDKDKLLSIMALGVIAITPIGSNNNIYSNLNNMFWVIPAFLYQVVRFKGNNEYFRGIRYSVTILSMAWFALCLCFGVNYVFRDGIGAPMDTEVKNNYAMSHMKTTATNAQRLTELSDLWGEREYIDREVLLYGDVCGLSFYLGSPCAISTTWPSLQSFSDAKFEKDIDELKAKMQNGGNCPVIILDSDEIISLDKDDLVEKQKILRNFMEEYSYNVIYTSDNIFVYDSKN